MIKIEAIVRSSAMYDVKNVLGENGITTFSEYQVQISGIHKGHSGAKNKASDYVPKSKIEVLCADEDEDKIIDIIQKSGSTGQKGDGIVFSYNINKLVKIKDKKTGADAL